MSFRNNQNSDPAHPAPDGEWPFPDDLDDYERELEASIARGEWKQVDSHEAELNRYQEMARIARATGNCGPVTDDIPLPAEWPDYKVAGGNADDTPVAPLPLPENGDS